MNVACSWTERRGRKSSSSKQSLRTLSQNIFRNRTEGSSELYEVVNGNPQSFEELYRQKSAKQV